MGKKKLAALLRSLWWHHDVAMRASVMEAAWGKSTVTRRIAATKKRRHSDAFERKLRMALSRLED